METDPPSTGGLLGPISLLALFIPHSLSEDSGLEIPFPPISLRRLLRGRLLALTARGLSCRLMQERRGFLSRHEMLMKAYATLMRHAEFLAISVRVIMYVLGVLIVMKALFNFAKSRKIFPRNL